PGLAQVLAHRRQGAAAPATVLVSPLDTDLGHTWARLDPTSLEENWFRLQNPAPETRPATIGSVLAALPDGPGRASRSAALRRALDSFRRSYPPAPDDGLAPPGVKGRGPLVWRRDSLLALQGIHVVAGKAEAGNRIENGTFDPEVSGPHPAMEIPALAGDRWQVGDDTVPGSWQVLAFAYKNRRWRRQAGGAWKGNVISLDSSLPPPAGRHSWGLPRMRPPHDDKEKEPEEALNQGRTWLLYTDGNTPFWIKVGQEVQLPAGRYRLTMSVYPAQETSGVPPREPGDSQVVLFAGEHRSPVLDGNELPYDQWGRARLEFELPAAASLQVGVELHGPARLLRNGWYLGAARLERLAEVADGWHVTAAQLRGLNGTGAGRTRHAAATLLPSQVRIGDQDNPRPVSLAASPYLGLEFRRAEEAEADIPAGTPGAGVTRLLAVELICLHAASGELRPAATKFWEAAEDLDEAMQEWGRETHRRLCPDSPLAVLRLREINEVGGQVTTGYRFAVVRDLAVEAPIERRAFPLRTAVEELRFREGQFGGQEMPEESHFGEGQVDGQEKPEGIAPFEIAPPQTTGVQPLYLLARPPAATDSTWPWGLSALRLSVRYTPGSQGVVGPATSGGNGEGDGDEPPPVTLWWQAPQQMVQYRTPGAANTAGRPAWSLPPLFRAPAIKSLLPVLPAPPLPTIDLSDEGLAAWQPVLPGSLHYLLLGARPGVMLAIRNQLLRQRLTAGQAGQRGRGLVSGSVPVQHRVPRPVPLPANRPEDREHALQPWASFFAPQDNLTAGASPADEAFFAAWDDQPARR
ncbi:MAG: hypothetical protein ACK2UY_12475, partial [Anaerolineae bacterium]